MNTALRIVPEDSGRKDYINRYISNDPIRGVLFTNFIELMVAKKAKRMSASYVNAYRPLLNHLNAFAQENDCELYTNSINEDFLDDFIVYLESKGLRQTYIKDLVEQIKTMARKAGTYNYAIDPSYNDVDVDSEVSFSIYLSMNDITRIYYYQGLSKAQERIRDLFVVGCLTALRYSDYSTLTRDNFQNGRIVKKTKKTGKVVTLPIHDYIKEIYAKYDGEISKGLTIQYFDRAIKQICRKIGFTERVTYNYTAGGELVTETKEKWQMISSHTARRSAATNLYMTGRLKTYEIMQLTGHSTERSFFRYIKVSAEDMTNHIAADNFFRK